MAEVYLPKDSKLELQVALKICRSQSPRTAIAWIDSCGKRSRRRLGIACARASDSDLLPHILLASPN
jgi:hypothetical protein